MSIRQLSRHLVTTVATTAIVAATLVGSSTAAVAVGPFGPPDILLACGGGMSIEADVNSTDGHTHAFSTCNGPGNDPQGSIRFRDHQAGAVPVSTVTPYTGSVASVANDHAGSTYVLYLDVTTLKLGKRNSDGSFAAPLVVAGSVAGPRADADLVARHGTWFAVWSTTVFSWPTITRQLRSAGDLSGNNELLTTGGSSWNSQPSASYDGKTLAVVWTRSAGDPATGPSKIMMATRNLGPFSVFDYTSLGTHNTRPEVVRVAGRNYVAWVRDGSVMEQDNSTGALVSITFAGPVNGGPLLAVPRGKVVVAWHPSNIGGTPLTIAERAAGAWTTDQPFGGPPLFLLAHAERARIATFPEPGAVEIRSQT